jgi:hypothetical protein
MFLTVFMAICAFSCEKTENSSNENIMTDKNKDSLTEAVILKFSEIVVESTGKDVIGTTVGNVKNDEPVGSCTTHTRNTTKRTSAWERGSVPVLCDNGETHNMILYGADFEGYYEVCIEGILRQQVQKYRLAVVSSEKSKTSWIGDYFEKGDFHFFEVNNEIWEMSQLGEVFQFYPSLIENNLLREGFDFSDDKLDELVKTYYPDVVSGIPRFWIVGLSPIFRAGLFSGIIPIRLTKISAVESGIFRVDLDVPENEVAKNVQPQFSVWFDLNKKVITKVEGSVFDLDAKDIHGELIREKYNED